MIHTSQRHHGRPRRFSPLVAGSVTMNDYYSNILKINALAHYSVKSEISKIYTCYNTGVLRLLNQWM